MSDHQHNWEGCDCIDPDKCNCGCHVIQAADALAKAFHAYLDARMTDGEEEWTAMKDALAAYEKARESK